MYSNGIGTNSSLAKVCNSVQLLKIMFDPHSQAIVHHTFAALGGDVQSQMALGYRYHSGVGVRQSCETALAYYRKVADIGA